MLIIAVGLNAVGASPACAEESEHASESIHHGDHGSESLLRIGGEYAFEMDTLEIAPPFAVDFVDGEEVLVLGVVFGKGF